MLPFTLPDSPSYAVAFSGGADSRLLLELTVRALLERLGEDGRSHVIALHLHHGIRGEEADRDEAFCRKVCEGLGVELICERVNIPAMAEETGESMETVARRVRYGFFGRVMDERGIGILLTAHHADDNLETVLAQLIRGSGTRGMRGIPTTRMLGYWTDRQIKLVHRPLLDFTKRDILAACEELSLDFVTASTNLEDHCIRNRIRHTVIPELEAIAGKDAPQRAAARMAHAAEEDEDYLWYHAEQSVGRTVAPGGEAVALSDLEHFNPSLSKRMLMVLYRDVLRLYDRGAETELFLSSVQLHAKTFADLAAEFLVAVSLLPADAVVEVEGYDAMPSILAEPLQKGAERQLQKKPRIRAARKGDGVGGGVGKSKGEHNRILISI